MSKQSNFTTELTFIPSEFDSVNSVYNTTGGDNSNGVYSTNYLENGLTDSNSSTRAAVYTVLGSEAVTKIYYKFNVSTIPDEATINSVNCTVKCGNLGTSYYTSGVAYLCTGTTIKGSGVTVTGTNSSPSIVSIGGDTWTRNELNEVRVLYLVTRGTSNTDTDSTLSFYGATLTINYTYLGVIYEITSLLSTDKVDSITPAGVEDVAPNESYLLRIDAASIDDILVDDNGINVTSLLVRNNVVNSGSCLGVAISATLSSIGGGVSYHTYPVGYTAENPHTYTSNMYASTRNATGVATYNFNFSIIPENATITSVEVKCSGKRESSTTDSTHIAQLSLYSGDILKGSSQEFTTTTQLLLTISDVGTWTREELQSAKLKFTVGYYGGALYGITWTIDYELPSTGNAYYWTYSLNNVSSDHTIDVRDLIIETPVEDPLYNYYPLTISSINATITPSRGTTRVIEGTNKVIEIYPTDPLLTLALDNSTDISSLLVKHGDEITNPTVTTESGADCGFDLNTITNYYVSTNAGIGKSAAVCRVDFNLPVKCLVTILYINYAETGHDFGVFGNVDTPLNNDAYLSESGGTAAIISDTIYKYVCSTSNDNTSVPKTITYEIPAGEHFIHIKYSKDAQTNSNNDNLLWKILDIEPLEPNNYYTYELSNINSEHSLVFVFGDVNYYFIKSTGIGCKLYPSGSIVQLPGDSYLLTIVPDDYSSSITITDNNEAVTADRVEQEITKDGNTYTVVNYSYRLSNIDLQHNISVSCYTSTSGYIKVDGIWFLIYKIYKKIDNAWVELTGSILNVLSSINNIVIPKVGILEQDDSVID